MRKKITFIVFAILCTLIGLYPAFYIFLDRTFGLLQSKQESVLNDVFWNIAFYIHIYLGGIALLIGWLQFIPKLRRRNIKLHRYIGVIYMISVIFSSISGLYIALFATGGWLSSFGFIGLAIVWFYATLQGFLYIKKGNINKHQQMMIYSYAATFAAVTLRIHLPVLVSIFKDFITAYTIVAWLCWVPNIIFAYYLNKNIYRQQIQ